MLQIHQRQHNRGAPLVLWRAQVVAHEDASLGLLSCPSALGPMLEQVLALL